MPAPQTDLLQGTLDLLILKALALQELHGMGVSRRIAQITGGAFDVKAGSLFPALHRMEQAGWLTSSWGESETNRRAKFYAVTKAGLVMLTQSLAVEHAHQGLRANVVCPGARTRLSTGPDYVAHVTELNRRGLLDDVSLQGSLDVAGPDYVAPTYVYLASDLAERLTGEIFVASGGFIGRYPRTTPAVIGYRDHHDSPPWSVAEVSALIDSGAA